MITSSLEDYLEYIHNKISSEKTVKAIDVANKFNVSRPTVSEALIKLADMDFQPTLAISLHAPEHELRRTLMPIENKYNLDKVKCSAFLGRAFFIIYCCFLNFYMIQFIW